MVGIFTLNDINTESTSPHPTLFLSCLSSENSLAVEINSLIQDVVVESGPCKDVSMIYHCADMLVLQLGINQEQLQIQDGLAWLPSSISPVSSLGELGGSGWMVKRCRVQSSFQGPLLLIRALSFPFLSFLQKKKKVFHK